MRISKITALPLAIITVVSLSSTRAFSGVLEDTQQYLQQQQMQQQLQQQQQQIQRVQDDIQRENYSRIDQDYLRWKYNHGGDDNSSPTPEPAKPDIVNSVAFQPGDVITISFNYSGLYGSLIASFSYTIKAGDTLQNITRNLEQQINSDSKMIAMGITATEMADGNINVHLPWGATSSLSKTTPQPPATTATPDKSSQASGDTKTQKRPSAIRRIIRHINPFHRHSS